MKRWTLAVAALSLAAFASAGAASEKKDAKAGGKAEFREAMPEPRTLEGYVEQEKFFWDWLKKNHPVFKYEKDGRLVGKYTLSDREEEFVEFGGGKKYSEAAQRPTSITYRLPSESFVDLPNRFVGPEKCGECHPAQYEKWRKSRHRMVVRFPDEMVEFGGAAGLKKPFYQTSDATPLADGQTPDFIYAMIGTPRTKYGFIDPYLVRGTYHVEGGTLKEGTGKIVAGGNQFSLTWARELTPEVAKKIQKWIPTFPTTMEGFGDSGSGHWGMTSYGAKNRKSMLFQPGTSYCEVCHSWKFDFKSQDEFLKALGDPAELRKHTISQGIGCEECHGAGAHLVGGNNRLPSNCERCHQRFAWNADDAKNSPDAAFNAYFKSKCPSCGTEGSQSFYSAHVKSGMGCSTCHDPHEVTQNDWRDTYTVPALKKTCASCHPEQAKFAKQSEMHGGNKCESCHMPTMMSCENFSAIQFPDQAGFDNVRASHIWKIKVDPELKSLNPPPGQPRDYKGGDAGPWRLAKDGGKSYLDLMWSCGRTSWAEKGMQDAGGCHSPVISQLPEELHFTSQKMIYEKVMAWENPVKAGVAEVKANLAKVRPALAAAKPGSANLAQATLMANQAQDLVDAVERDGSNGVHAPRYTREQVNQARVLAAGALKLAGVKIVSMR